MMNVIIGTTPNETIGAGVIRQTGARAYRNSKSTESPIFLSGTRPKLPTLVGMY